MVEAQSQSDGVALAAQALPQEDPTARTLRRWIAGIAAYLGIINVMVASYTMPALASYVAQLVAGRVSVTLYGAYLIITLLGSLAAGLATIWGAWWCIFGDGLGARTLRWSTLALVFLALCGMGERLWNLWHPNSAGTEPGLQAILTAVILSFRTTLLPGIVASLTLNRAIAHILTRKPADGAAEDKVEGPKVVDGAEPSVVDLEFSGLAVRHIVRVLAWTAIVMGAPGLLATAHQLFVVHGKPGWVPRGLFSEYFMSNFTALLSDVSHALLTFGGVALLRHWRYRWRLILAGYATALATVVTQPIAWAHDVSAAVLMLYMELPMIVCIATLMRLLILESVRAALNTSIAPPKENEAQPVAGES